MLELVKTLMTTFLNSFKSDAEIQKQNDEVYDDINGFNPIIDQSDPETLGPRILAVKEKVDRRFEAIGLPPYNWKNF